MGRRRSGPGQGWKLAALGLLFAMALVLVPYSLQTHRVPGAGQSYATITPVPSEPTTVFVGGASAHGAGASDADQRWITVASKALGWHEVEQAAATSGFTTTSCSAGRGCKPFSSTIDAVVKARPQVVVVACDPTGTSSSPSRDQVATYFRALRRELPEATIIGVGPWASRGAATSEDRQLESAVESGVVGVRGVFVSLLEPALVDPSMTTSRGASLNDIGHQAVADRVISRLDGTSKT